MNKVIELEEQHIYQAGVGTVSDFEYGISYKRLNGKVADVISIKDENGEDIEFYALPFYIYLIRTKTKPKKITIEYTVVE